MQIRRHLSYLAQFYGANPSLRGLVLRQTKPKPRNVVATDVERASLLQSPHLALRCWVLMCSDLAIRAGTACVLGPQHYDQRTRMLRFVTKYGNTQALRVTGELASLFDLCTNPSMPFVAQLPRGVGRSGGHLCACGHMSYQGLIRAFRLWKGECGITRKLTPHDLRRTTARKVYKGSGDLRHAQAVLGHSDLSSTVWYLQDDLVEVTLDQLEAAKVNHVTTEVIQ